MVLSRKALNLYTGGLIATFLHTRSVNILRRLGIAVKRKTSENH